MRIFFGICLLLVLCSMAYSNDLGKIVTYGLGAAAVYEGFEGNWDRAALYGLGALYSDSINREIGRTQRRVTEYDLDRAYQQRYHNPYYPSSSPSSYGGRSYGGYEGQYGLYHGNSYGTGTTVQNVSVTVNYYEAPQAPAHASGVQGYYYPQSWSSSYRAPACKPQCYSPAYNLGGGVHYPDPNYRHIQSTPYYPQYNSSERRPVSITVQVR